MISYSPKATIRPAGARPARLRQVEAEDRHAGLPMFA